MDVLALPVAANKGVVCPCRERSRAASSELCILTSCAEIRQASGEDRPATTAGKAQPAIGRADSLRSLRSLRSLGSLCSRGSGESHRSRRSLRSGWALITLRSWCALRSCRSRRSLRSLRPRRTEGQSVVDAELDVGTGPYGGAIRTVGTSELCFIGSGVREVQTDVGSSGRGLVAPCEFYPEVRSSNPRGK